MPYTHRGTHNGQPYLYVAVRTQFFDALLDDCLDRYETHCSVCKIWTERKYINNISRSGIKEDAITDLAETSTPLVWTTMSAEVIDSGVINIVPGLVFRRFLAAACTELASLLPQQFQTQVDLEAPSPHTQVRLSMWWLMQDRAVKSNNAQAIIHTAASCGYDLS